MSADKQESKEFVDFLSVMKEDDTTENRKPMSQKEAEKQRLEQSFIPLIDSTVHTDIVGENMRITVNKEEDAIKSIDIECRCGCKSRLIFEHEE